MYHKNSSANSSKMMLINPITRPVVFGGLIVLALVAFEIFNFSTTQYALRDMLGSLKFSGIPWATILAIAFCGIDFAGLARMFTPEVGKNEPREVWYLFGAWMLAALMNAILTWWGVASAIANHETLGNAIIARGTLLKVVPVFVAIMVWLIRVLIIGTFTVAGEGLFGKTNPGRGNSYGLRASTWKMNRQPGLPQSFSSQPINSRIPRAANRAEYRSRPHLSHNQSPAILETAYMPPVPQVAPVEPHVEEPQYVSDSYSAEPVYVPVGMAGRSQGNVHSLKL